MAHDKSIINSYTQRSTRSSRSIHELLDTRLDYFHFTRGQPVAAVAWLNTYRTKLGLGKGHNVKDDFPVDRIKPPMKEALFYGAGLGFSGSFSTVLKHILPLYSLLRRMRPSLMSLRNAGVRLRLGIWRQLTAIPDG